MSDEDSSQQPRPNPLRRLRDDALQLGPRKKAFVFYHFSKKHLLTYQQHSCIADPLIHHGRHFGRTVHALCSVHSVIVNGILRLGELADEPEESFTSEYVYLSQLVISLFIPHSRHRRQFRVFDMLLKLIPGLEERITHGSDEETMRLAELV